METELENPTTEPAPPSALVRPQKGRWLAGVAAGIADRIGMPRWLARLLFVVAFASGGIGVFLYLAGWLLIPSEDEPENLARKLSHRIQGSSGWVGLGLILVAGAIVLNMFPFIDGGLIIPTALLVVGILLYRGELPGRPPRNVADATHPDRPRWTPPPASARPPVPPSPLGRLAVGAALIACGVLLVVDRVSPLVDAGWRHYLALAIAVLGLGLVVGAFVGHARWLIFLAAALVPFLITATSWEFAGNSTSLDVAPTAFDQLPATIEHGAGTVTVDLSQLPWEGEAVDLRVRLGAGRVHLLVPAGVALNLQGRVGVGSIDGTGGYMGGGIGVNRALSFDGGELGYVNADVEVGAGGITVQYSDTWIVDPGSDGDLLIRPSSEDLLLDSLEGGYVTLDLSDLALTGDRNVTVNATRGITVVIPPGMSYRINAQAPAGSVTLFDDEVHGGTVIIDSIAPDSPVLYLDLVAVNGQIVLTRQGEMR
jgi:phage shock protein PspC (stress-responsive transcriptional regulator)